MNPTTGGGGSGKVNPSYLPSPFSSLLARFPSAQPAKGNNCSAGVFEENTDFNAGTGLGHADGSSASDCCQKCASVSGCVYFSYKKSGSGKGCWFKKTDAGRKSDT
jgi:hypothetical protein